MPTLAVSGDGDDGNQVLTRWTPPKIRMLTFNQKQSLMWQWRGYLKLPTASFFWPGLGSGPCRKCQSRMVHREYEDAVWQSARRSPVKHGWLAQSLDYGLRVVRKDPEQPGLFGKRMKSFTGLRSVTEYTESDSKISPHLKINGSLLYQSVSFANNE